MNKKYFFFDIDGTLTNKETGEFIPSAKQTIQKLQERGHFVCIATGRAYYKTKAFAKEADIHYIVCSGGAALVVNDELMENRPLNHLKAVALCEEASKKGYGILIATDDSINVTMLNDQFISQVGYRQEPTRYILNQSLSYQNIPNFNKIYIAINQTDECHLSLCHSLGNIRFADEYLTYQHDEKDKGILKMVTRMGGQLKDVVVFGDDYNDLVMFKDEWTSIAMGNACDELKAKASFVTKASYDDGIEYACRYYGWIS